MDIHITKLSEVDKKECLDLVEKVVIDGFIDEGIDVKKEDNHLRTELEIQKNRINNFSENYLLAKINGYIVGMIAYLKPCEVVTLASKKLRVDIRAIQEVISLYIRPEYQRQGIGSMLFSAIVSELKDRNVQYFAISTGYKKGRAFWAKKLGKESIVFPTYYSGHPCTIWIKKTSDIM